MEELLEYFVYNYGKKNEEIVEKLSPIVENIEDEELKSQLSAILGIAKGYTEYKAKEIAETTGLNRSRVKALIKQLDQEDKIDILVENKITFIIPKL